MIDLPETTDIVRRVELEPAALALYKNLVDVGSAELASGESGKVQQVSGAKLAVLEDIVDSAFALRGC